MCGIAGFLNPRNNDKKTEKEIYQILKKMNEVQRHRGPDDEGIFLENGCALGHVRLSILDLYRGHQPMCKKKEGNTYAIILNGEIYNMKTLKEQLIKEGEMFSTTSDTEVVLTGYIRYGISYIEELNGIFSIALWDGKRKKLYLIRDRVGVKPLFYTKRGDTLIFASEIKGLFAYPGVKPVINREGLCEIFGLGPAKSYGKGVFKDIYEVLPGHFLEYDREGLKDRAYWELKAKEHTDSEKDTIEHTRWLVKDAVEMQMLSDIPISTFLSGGVDSSLVTAICAKKLQKEGKNLNTFSFDFVNNHKYFKSNAFQPSEDRPWVDKMVDHAKTDHRYLECDNENMIENLYKAVDARDLPCMADVESSMLYFCSKVVKYNKVTLTGECADEIFGGYPWFYKKELYSLDSFPWIRDIDQRLELLNENIKKLNIKEYVQSKYYQSLNEIDYLDQSFYDTNKRKMIYLNIEWFMQTLLTRSDSQSMYNAVELRVPFASKEIVEYMYNVPWTYMFKDQQEKAVLRDAFKDFLPQEIYNRKKNPYPKTHSPFFLTYIKNLLLETLNDKNNILYQLFDIKKLKHFIENSESIEVPWFGQLMMGPQLLAYFYQIYMWGKIYHIELEL